MFPKSGNYQVNRIIGSLEAQSFRDGLEDSFVFFAARGRDFQLVRNAAEKGRIHQVLGRQIGREDDELIKWQGKALTRVELQILGTAFQGHDPAVEQSLGAHDSTKEKIYVTRNDCP